MPRSNETYDVVVVGAGIQGLAQARAAAMRGLRVLVLERSPRALGASVRNFGMIWPIGQPRGLRLELALQSRRIWLDFARAAALPLRDCGSLFVAIDNDEAEVMEDFARNQGGDGLELTWLDRTACASASSLVRPDAVVGGMLSATEAGVDPWQAMEALAAWLSAEHGVDIAWNESVVEASEDGVATNRGRIFSAERVVICEGASAMRLFPEAFEGQDLVPCRLQMLRTMALGLDMGPMLATGLTLRHYPSFRIAARDPARFMDFDRRVASENAAIDRYGIHVMVAQDREGRLVLGDSHVYDSAITPFRSERIDQVILDELDRRFLVRALPIEERWLGTYLVRRGHAVFVHDVLPNVRIVNGLGGNGMTLSFGIAERMWLDWNDADLLAGLPEANASSAPHETRAT